MDLYRSRLVDPLLANLLAELPALFISGPRATGKTTTAARLSRTRISLDRPADAAAFHADPDAALRGLREPVLLDEWQAVPAVLGAVKRAVDADPRPGRYLITGSVRGDLDDDVWPGTGRLVRVPMYGMVEQEVSGELGRQPFLDRVASGEALAGIDSTEDLRDYVSIAVRGGFPEPALRLGSEARFRWLESYVDHLLTRDAESVDSGRDPVRLRRYLEAYSLNTAGAVTDKTLFDASGINRKTAQAYERLLSNLLIVEALPAWASNRLKRLVLSPKRYVIDPSIAAAVLGVDSDAIMRDGDLLGRLLDTLVLSQLRSQAVVCRTRPRFYHLRQEQGRIEVDVLAELSAGRLVGIEVKASAAPDASDARHLATLRDSHDDRFVAGLVLHTGRRSYELGDRLTAVPISALWN